MSARELGDDEVYLRWIAANPPEAVRFSTRSWMCASRPSARHWASASNRRGPRLEVVGADGADRVMAYRIRR
jgi:hypothetical protein